MSKKKYLSFLLSGAMLVSLFPPITSTATSPTYQIKVGQPLDVNAAIELPELNKEAEGLSIKWEIEDRNVAKMNYKGEIIGVSEGTTKVKGYVKENPNVSVEFQVDVDSTVESITLIEEMVEMTLGETTEVGYAINPSEAYLQDVKWSTSNRNVVTVNTKGQIKAVGVGEAVVTVETKDGGHQDTVKIKVTSPINGLEATEETIVLGVGEKQNLPIVLESETDDTQTLLYTTTNRDVIRVSTKGQITALKEGEAEITVKTKDGQYEETIKVIVASDVEELFVLDEEGLLLEDVSLEVGKTIRATAVSDVDDLKSLDNYNAKWTSSNPEVVQTFINGSFKAVGVGEAIITVTLPQELSPVSYSFKVTTTSSITDIQLNQEKLEMNIGDKETLQATVYPLNAPNKAIKWKSDNTKVATVFNGTVRAVSSGTTTIYAMSQDGSVIAECVVTVKSTATGINAPESIQIYVGEQFEFTPNVEGEKLQYNPIYYELTKEEKSLLKVYRSYNGLYRLTGLKPGTLTIDLQTKDGMHQKTITVEVLPTTMNLVINPTVGN